MPSAAKAFQCKWNFSIPSIILFDLAVVFDALLLGSLGDYRLKIPFLIRRLVGTGFYKHFSAKAINFSARLSHEHRCAAAIAFIRRVR